MRSCVRVCVHARVWVSEYLCACCVNGWACRTCICACCRCSRCSRAGKDLSASCVLRTTCGRQPRLGRNQRTSAQLRARVAVPVQAVQGGCGFGALPLVCLRVKCLSVACLAVVVVFFAAWLPFSADFDRSVSRAAVHIGLLSRAAYHAAGAPRFFLRPSHGASARRINDQQIIVQTAKPVRDSRQPI